MAALVRPECHPLHGLARALPKTRAEKRFAASGTAISCRASSSAKTSPMRGNARSNGTGFALSTLPTVSGVDQSRLPATAESAGQTVDFPGLGTFTGNSAATEADKLKASDIGFSSPLHL
jgi:hypothetical protein